MGFLSPALSLAVAGICQTPPVPSGEVAAGINAAAKLAPKPQLDALSKVLLRAQALKDRDGEANVLLYMALDHMSLNSYREAEQESVRAQAIAISINDQMSVGMAGLIQGESEDALYEPSKARNSFRIALKVFKALGLQSQVAQTEMGIGTEDESLGDLAAALDIFRQAQLDFAAVKNGENVAQLFVRIGILQCELGQFAESKSTLESALKIWKERGDNVEIARVINAQGALAMEQSDQATALELYDRALKLAREARDSRVEAVVLGNIAHAYDDLSQRAKSIEFYNRALVIHRSIGNKRDETTTLNNLATAYAELGERDTAGTALNQALTIAKSTGDAAGQASILNNLGALAQDAGKLDEARSDFHLALELTEASGNPRGLCVELQNIGSAFQTSGNLSGAMGCFKRELQLAVSIGDPAAEAGARCGLGAMESATGKLFESGQDLSRCLVIARRIGNRDIEEKALLSLADLAVLNHSPDLAIFYGKLAVNVLQSIRRDIVGIGVEASNAYRSEVGSRYELLANFMARNGRFGEAESVLALLKDDEYFHFLNTRAAATSQTVDLSELEQTWSAKYDTIFKEFGSLSSEYENLAAVNLGKRTEVQKARIKQIDSRFEAANRALNDYFERAQVAFAKVNATTERLTDLQAATGMTDTLKSLPNSPAAIYTMITEDGVHLLVNLPNGSVLREPTKNIKANDLSLKVLAFRRALQDPRVDPRPLGAELYDLLVRPIEPDLLNGKVGTIMWSLDSWLRYIPMWALYDSKAGKYLIEKYPSALFTPRTLNKQTHDVHPADWAGVEFGVSIPRTVGGLSFPGLPGVPNELKTVAAHVGGAPKLDGAFTKDAFTDALALKPKIIHIATHFNFIPGDDKDSFLLLGNSALSVDDFKALRSGALDGVELLVLSACNTAGGDTRSDGGEFESFALLAQLKGADAVMASLWQVNDASTALLMGEFYKLRKAHPEWTKLEALRQAQLEMIHGTLSGDGDASRGSGLQSKVEGQPAWTGKGFTHPFYWAPFELVGNWK